MPKPGLRTTYKYSDEFKATALRLSQLAGVEVQDVCRVSERHLRLHLKRCISYTG